MEPRKESLKHLVDKIKQDKILLPDFQRKFVWTDEFKQKKLISSVLAKMPIGSILLLQSAADGYASKALGAKEQRTDSLQGEVEFLLDGQQRMTVLTNVFSDIIFYTTGLKPSNLISPSLKKRFFICIPSYDELHEGKKEDLFGVYKLDFPLKDPSNDEPPYVTGEILPHIEAISFNAIDKDKKNHFNPYNKPRKSDIVRKCIKIDQNEGFLIPLFLLLENRENTSENDLCLREILENIANYFVKSKIEEFEALQNIEDKKVYVKQVLTDEIYNGLSDDELEWEESFKSQLSRQGQVWSDNFKVYLKSCIDQINLNQVVVKESQRKRAIDIYESLNLGGVSLDIFDLVMARVAVVSHGDFYDRLANNISDGSDYHDYLLPDRIKNQAIPVITHCDYSVSENMECYDANKNEFSKTYLNTFLNLITLLCQCKSVEDISVEHLKREKKLELDPINIHDNCERTCEAIDRALFFFQCRCGIRKIGDINYTLMILVVAYIFSDDSNYENIRVHDLLEAWYWSSIFSGEYDSDQNEKTIEFMKKLSRTIASMNAGELKIDWLTSLKDNILNKQNFSDKQTLMFVDIEFTERIPKSIIKDGICQFLLSEGYQDFFDDNITISVYSDRANTLNQHHVIPLGSVDSMKNSAREIRNNPYHILNSPLNFVYIISETNNKISNMNLADYQSKIQNYASLETLAFGSLVNVKSEDDIKKVLEDRYNKLRGMINKRVNKLIPVATTV